MNARALAFVSLLAAFAAPSARAAVPAVPTLPVSDVRPGQHAVVRTVFAGDSIETFEADILGVMSNGRADGQIILARATSPRVVQCGVAAGMSGSPVYVDGKLIGALALGWPFSKEPIFGVTPIGDMLRVLDQPERPAGPGSSGPAGLAPLPRSAYRELAWADDSLAAAPAAPATAGRPVALPIPLAAGGLAPEAFDYARSLFEGTGFLLTPGGRGAVLDTARAAAKLVPGAAVAVDVLRGDLNFSAIGTVTYRDRDQLLIFGHPFFQAGDVRLPLSTASIVGILPSLYDSFKLGMPGTPVGVATQDRRPAVGGHIGGRVHLMPFSIELRDGAGPPRTYRFESIEDRLLMPQLLATAAMSCLMERGGASPLQTVEWTLTAWRGRDVLRMHDRVTGDTPLAEAAGGSTGAIRFLVGNSFETWMPDSAAITLAVSPRREQWTVRGARLLDAAVRPGGVAHARVEIERWQGERRTLDVQLPVPAELPNGRYTLWLGGGAEYDRIGASRLPSRYRPTSVADGVRRLAALKSSDALYAALWARAADVSRDGEDYPDLPSSAMPLLAPALEVGGGIRRGDWALVGERSVSIEGVLRGEAALDVNVDDRAP